MLGLQSVCLIQIELSITILFVPPAGIGVDEAGTYDVGDANTVALGDGSYDVVGDGVDTGIELHPYIEKMINTICIIFTKLNFILYLIPLNLGLHGSKKISAQDGFDL